MAITTPSFHPDTPLGVKDKVTMIPGRIFRKTAKVFFAPANFTTISTIKFDLEIKDMREMDEKLGIEQSYCTGYKVWRRKEDRPQHPYFSKPLPLP